MLRYVALKTTQLLLVMRFVRVRVVSRGSSSSSGQPISLLLAERQGRFWLKVQGQLPPSGWDLPSGPQDFSMMARGRVIVSVLSRRGIRRTVSVRLTRSQPSLETLVN